MPLTIRPIGPVNNSFGAEVSGIDLSRPLGNEGVAAIWDAIGVQPCHSL